MRKQKWSPYDKFMVVADQSNGKISGTFTSYQEYKEVLEALQSISDTNGPEFKYKGNIYNKPITSDKARGILEQLDNAYYHKELFAVSKRIKINLVDHG